MEAQKETVPDILVPNDFSKSVWAINHTESGGIDDFYQYSLVDDFMYKKVFNTYDSELGFGRYEGRTIKQVYEIDRTYLEFCIRELEHFFLSANVINDLVIDNYQFSQETTDNYKQKLCDYKSGVFLLNRRDDDRDDERDEYERTGGGYDEDDWGGDIDNNSHYNDDLDMDQQSQEFWDNL